MGGAFVGLRLGVPLFSGVLEVPRDETAGHLRDLHGLDFVFPSVPEPEPMYSFKHALTQDVVYAGVLERRRRQFHAAAGRGPAGAYAGGPGEGGELLAPPLGRGAEPQQGVGVTP